MAETMRLLHTQGYTASTRDLHSNFALYSELLALLGVADVPAAVFFHGSGAPPQQIFAEGIDLESCADPNAFAGSMFYGSVAPKAATYARPYLYLCMVPWSEKVNVYKPKDRADAHSEQAKAADVLLIGDHTRFDYPEFAIRDATRVTLLACFVMDCPMLSHFPAMDAQRRERLLWNDAQAGAYRAWLVEKEELAAKK